MNSVETVSRLIRDISSSYYPNGQSLGHYFIEKLNEAIQACREYSAGYDPVRIVAALKVRAYASEIQAGTGGDEIEFSISLVDTAALILYSDKELKPESEYPPASVDANGIGAVVELIVPELQKVRLLSILICSSKRREGQEADWLNRRHLASLQWIRETSYSSSQIEVFDKLFGESEIENLIERERGYSYKALKRLLLWSNGLKDRLLSEARDESLKIAHSRHLSYAQSRKFLEDALVKLLAPRLCDATFSAEDAARGAGIPLGAVIKILNDFSVSLTEISVEELPDLILGGRNPLQARPFARERNGRFFLIDESLTTSAIKANLEETLLAKEVYCRTRGRLLESLLVDELSDYFGSQNVCSGVKYSTPDGMRGEADAIVVQGDVAIIFEAKAATIFKPGASVSTKAFVQKMRANIHKASLQLERLRTIIESEGKIPVERGKPFELDRIREIHTVIVTLEDLLELSTQRVELLDSRLLAHGTSVPWIASYNDLRLILILAEDPAEFLVYLRRRRNPSAAKRFRSTDELDLFLYFRKSGLWVEAQGDSVVAEYVMPLTAELDKWYIEDKVEKPSIKNTAMLKYVRQAHRLGIEHWFEFGATLLEMAEDAQSELQSWIDKAYQLSEDDGQPHSVTAGFDGMGLGNDGVLLVFAIPGTSKDEKWELKLDQYLDARRQDFNYQRAFACVLGRSGEVVDLRYSVSPRQLRADARGI